MKQTLPKSSILLTTALVSSASMAFAEGHDAEQLAVSQLTQAASMSGTTSFGAYTIAPSWSEELGFSLKGAIGYTLDEKSALGLVVTGGEKLREALLNFGFTIDAERQIVLSAGQLQEKLTFGEGEAEWVKQNEFGIAYDATNYSLNIFHVDSEATDNFVGAKSTGLEMEGTVALSSLASLDYGVGYEKLEWDDDSVGEEGVTGRLSFDVQANDTTVVNVFADHNLSENQYGIGATWALGAGSLTASYTYIEGLVGAVGDDQRVSVAFNMPLGAATPTTTTVSSSGIAAARANNLLADVMKRPEFLTQGVIASANSVLDCSNEVISTANPYNAGYWTSKGEAYLTDASLEGSYDLYRTVLGNMSLVKSGVELVESTYAYVMELEIAYEENEYNGSIYFIAAVNGQCRTAELTFD